MDLLFDIILYGIIVLIEKIFNINGGRQSTNMRGTMKYMVLDELEVNRQLQDIEKQKGRDDRDEWS